MTAIFFSKYIIQTSQTGIVNVVFNHVVCSARGTITNPVCCVYDTANFFLIQCISSDTHTTLKLDMLQAYSKG